MKRIKEIEMKECLLGDYIKQIKSREKEIDTKITSLSPEVQRIITCEYPKQECTIVLNQKFDEYFIREGNENEMKSQCEYFKVNNNETVFNLDYFHQFVSLVEKPQVEEYKPIINQLLSLQFPLQKKEDVDYIGFTLYLTTQIEKMIATIHKKNSSKQLPRTLSETLQLMYNEKTIPQEIIVLCSFIIGPPVSLNIRNLVWHGFLEESEVTCTLIGLVIILYQTIHQFHSYEIETKQLNDIQQQFLRDIIPIDRNDLLYMIEQSPFILPKRKSLICSIIQQEMNENEDIHYQSIMHLIVELEHLLRISFVTVNDVNTTYSMANYSSYYTTMDILLQEDVVSSIEGLIVNRPSTVNEIKATKYKNSAKFSSDKNEKEEIKESIHKVPNKLPTILGKELLSQLHDIFLHEGGIKLRDCISHGEYDIKIVGDKCISYLHYLFYCVLKKMNCWYFKEECKFPESIIKFQERFPTFHPLSFCKRIFGETSIVLNDVRNHFSSFDYSRDELEDYRNYQHHSLLSNNWDEQMSIIESILSQSTELFPLFGEPLFLSNIKHTSILLVSIEKCLNFLKDTHVLLISLQISHEIKRRQSNALFKLLNHHQELLSLLHYLLILSQLIFYEYNQKKLSQILKSSTIYSSKLFVLLEKYSFEDYTTLSNSYFVQITKYLSK